MQSQQHQIQAAESFGEMATVLLLRWLKLFFSLSAMINSDPWWSTSRRVQPLVRPLRGAHLLLGHVFKLLFTTQSAVRSNRQVAFAHPHTHTLHQLLKLQFILFVCVK